MMDDNANYGSTTAGPFRATKMWNTMVAAVRAEMPIGRRRKKLKTFENCFSGSEAVTWMVDYLKRNRDLLLPTGQVVTREKVTLLLQKFVEQKIIQDVRGRSVPFKDSGNHLYTFNKENVAPSGGQPGPAEQLADHPACGRNSHEDYAAMFRTPSAAGPGSSSGRVADRGSSLYGHTGREPGVSTAVAADYGRCSLPTSSSKGGHHHGQGRREPGKYPQTPRTGHASPPNLPPPTPNASSSPKELVPLADIPLLTRQILWRRLQDLFGGGGQAVTLPRAGGPPGPGQVDVLKAFSLHITDWSPIEVCHNVCQVSASGIVLPRTKEDDVPMLVIQAMKCLAKWPQSAAGYPTYPSFLNDALNLVQDHFCRQLLLPRTLYELSIVAFAPLMAVLQQPETPLSLQYETAFVTANPETKILPRTARKAALPRNVSQTPSTLPKPVQYRTERLTQTCVRAASVRRLGVAGSCYVNSAFSASSSSLSSAVSAVSEPTDRACRDAANKKEQVVRQLQHLYLALSPRSRRALHLLLRFMYKVGQNEALKIREGRPNLGVLVEKFSPCLVGALRTNLEQTSMFMTFLVENCDVVFAVPESLRQEIDAAIGQKRSQ